MYRWVKALLVLAALWLSLAGVAFAQKSIKIDFDSTDKFMESDNVEGTAAKSGLTADQKKKVIAQIQKEYDDAVGVGKVAVSEGKGGDVNVIVNGGKAPGVNAGKEYGDAGKPGKSGVVHEGEFKANGFAGDELVNGIAESAAHEAGHKLGLVHNWDTAPNTKMTEGGKVTDAVRKADARAFNTSDKANLNKNLGLKNAEQKDSYAPFKHERLGVFIGDSIAAPLNQPDDTYLDAYAIFSGPVGMEFGYLSSTDEFVFQGDSNNGGGNPAFMSFIYTASQDIAVRYGSEVVALSSDLADFLLSELNPFNSAVYRVADLYFNTSAGVAHLTLSATIDSSTGGFHQVPEPGTLLLVALALLLALIVRNGAAESMVRFFR